MVNRFADEVTLQPRLWRKPAKGHIEGIKRGSRLRINVSMPEWLFKKISQEAFNRGISMNALIVELCSASIEGIE